jgi:hypothetical protein
MGRLSGQGFVARWGLVDKVPRCGGKDRELLFS